MKLLNKNTLIILFLIIFSYPFLIKYTFVQHNPYVDIPMIKRIIDSKYLANDWVLNYNGLFSPRFYYTNYIAVLSRFFPLTAVYLANYIITVTLVTFATFLVAYKIYRVRTVAFLTTITVLFGQVYTFGGNYLINRDLDPNGIAFALVVAGFALILYGKYYFAPFLFATAGYLHILIGFEMPLLFYAAFIIVNFKDGKKTAVLTLSKSLVLYLLLSGYSLYEYILTFVIRKDAGIPDNLMIFILTKIRAPFHYLPSSWPVINYVIFISLIVLIYAFIRLYRNEMKSEVINYIKLLFPVIIFLNVLAYVFTEIRPLYSLIAFQFFRINVLLFWFGSMIIFGGCFYCVKKLSGKSSFLYSTVILIPFILARPETVLVPGPTHFIFVIISIIYCFFIIRHITSDLILVVIALAIFYLPFRHYRFQFSELYPMYSPEIDTAIWAKNHTAAGSVFLTPLDFYFFKMNAERPTVVNFEDMPFHPRGMIEWHRRLTDIAGLNNVVPESITRDKIFDGYSKMDQDRINRLMGTYQFDYIILDKKISIPFTPVYSNDRYNIYHL